MNQNNFIGPVNIGSDEMVTINELAKITMEIAEKKIVSRTHIRTLGVNGRN